MIFDSKLDVYRVFLRGPVESWVKYAAHYNKSLKRVGPVFGDRFRSEKIEDDAYLLGVVRYLHRNPVQAELVTEVSAYPWSSYGEYLAVLRFIAPLQKHLVLGLFGNDHREFVAFHQQEDNNVYLEAKEDAEKYRKARPMGIIESFCERSGALYARELRAHDELFTEICLELVNDAGLSLRHTKRDGSPCFSAKRKVALA